MKERKSLVELFGIEVSFKKVSVKQMPTIDKAYFLDCERIESRYFYLKYTKPKTYIACNLKNIKTSRSKVFYFIGGPENNHINDIFYHLVDECYWYVSHGLDEFENAKKTAKSKSDYEKLRFVFDQDFSELLHKVVEDRVAEGNGVLDMIMALSMMPETSDKTIKLFLALNLDNGILENLMKHPAAKNLVAFS